MRQQAYDFGETKSRDQKFPLKLLPGVQSTRIESGWSILVRTEEIPEKSRLKEATTN
jgi:hypothetical protein